MGRGPRAQKVLAAAGVALVLTAALAAGLAQVCSAEPSPGVAEDAAAAAGPPEGERFVFQAEVTRLLDIIINSLYSNKDIFLRELISNASDALDKIRLLALTEPDALGKGSARDLEVRVSFDKENKVLSIKDSGIGMTRQDLINNLGTIAKSGTSAFLDSFNKEADMNLIGQFGVGFYSAFLVADKVQVMSKHNDDPDTHVWESAADGNFQVTKVDNGASEEIGRGTKISLFLKDDAGEFVDQSLLGEVLAKYSEFINYPIYLLREVEREVEAEAEELDLNDDDLDLEEEGDEEGEGAEPEVVKKVIKEWEWDLQNKAQAVWLRSAGEVNQTEYDGFFKSISQGMFAGEEEKALAHTHFKAEGDVEFRSILFIPKRRPLGLDDMTRPSAFSRIKLYVRRVFISDKFDDLMPRWLSFVLGIVDSDTLPLNVSRETLHHHASLKTIKKKLVRKVLDLLKKMADTEKKEVEEGSVDGEKKYSTFWKEFGFFLKLGLSEDQTNRLRLAKLLRFHSSHEDYNTEGGDVTSFQDYVSRMPDTQKHIYYLIGGSVEELERSAFAETLKSRGLEVIYFIESVDEYAMQYLTEFEDVKLQNAARDDLDVGEDDADSQKRQKALRDSFRPFTKWWKKALPDDVDSVKVSKRLTESPCVVVSSKYGWTANMEKIMKAQAMQDQTMRQVYRGKKVLEINPFHPSIKRLREMSEQNPEDEQAAEVALLMYETSLLESGFEPEDPREYAVRVYKLLDGIAGVDPEAKVLDDFVLVDPEPEMADEEGQAFAKEVEEALSAEEEEEERSGEEEGAEIDDDDEDEGGMHTEL